MEQYKNTSKKKVFVLSPYPYDRAPSQRFRYEQYITELETANLEFYFFPFLNESGWKLLYQPGNMLKKIWYMMRSIGNRFTLLFKLKQADIVFVHREMAHFGPPIFEWLSSKVFKIKYIYDFDDAIWLPNYSAVNSKFHWVKWYQKVPKCIRWASKVSVGNAYLAEYAKQFNSSVQIIPTTIDMLHYHNQTIDYTKTKITIGWTGSHTTISYLNTILPVIKRLEQKYDFEFVVISNKNPNFDLKSFVFKQWAKNTEITDLLSFSIGIMPLKNDPWSKGKCGFKALQYMSLGIPTIASPIGVNAEIIKQAENGYLAQNEEDFYSYLAQLIENHNLRKEIGLKGQETIHSNYSVSANIDKYMALFS